MHHTELKARREALGISQTDLARLLNVKQSTISLWESGKRAPRDPIAVSMHLHQLEDAHDEIIEKLCENTEHASALHNSPNVAIRTFQTDDAYWNKDARARELQIPASMHRSAAAWAKRIVEEEYGIQASICE